MEQQIHITLQFELAIGKVNLNEIVHRLEQIKNPLMTAILKTILTSYDDEISDRLSPQSGVMTPSKMRKSLGRHVRKSDPDMVVQSDVDQMERAASVDLADLSAIMADATGYEGQKGKKGELRAVIGITTAGTVEPLGTFANTGWGDIEQTIKQRLKQTKATGLPALFCVLPVLLRSYSGWPLSKARVFSLCTSLHSRVSNSRGTLD